MQPASRWRFEQIGMSLASCFVVGIPHRQSGEGRNPLFVLAMDSGFRRNDGEVSFGALPARGRGSLSKKATAFRPNPRHLFRPPLMLQRNLNLS
jgi:hypothetical protein